MQVKFQAEWYIQLKSILPTLKGVQFDWHPESKDGIATFHGDPLAATNAAFKNGELTKEQADFMYEILHPDNRSYGHGGPRPGAGRPAKYGEPMKQTTVRLPQEWIDQLCLEFGSLQSGIETLVKNHFLSL